MNVKFMFHVKFSLISLTLGQFPPTKGLLLEGDKFNRAKLKKMIARWNIMASQNEKASHWSSGKLGTSLLKIFIEKTRRKRRSQSAK